MDKKLYKVFSENLKKWLQRRDKTQNELAKYIGVSSPTVSDWVNGKKMPRADKLQSIANWLAIDLSDLLINKEAESVGQVKAQHTITAVRIPVLGRVAAGIPISAVTDIIDWEEITPEMAADGEYFGLQIKGDSMEPRICNGDVVICRQQEDADDGDTVIALINGEDATCKKLKKYPDGTICLIPTNPAYQPLIFTVDEINRKPVRVIGVVKELRGKF